MSSLADKDASPKKEEPKKSVGDTIEVIAGWIVDIVSIPFQFAGSVMAQFVEPGTSGARILGMVMFAAGVVLSADGIWQAFFQGSPLFPWFEELWIGWLGWLALPFNPLFWLAIVISWCIQQAEAKTLRSKRPALAKTDYEESTQYNLPSKPGNKIDLSRALWRDYKRAGMRERNAGGLISLLIWMLDFASTFYGRNPFSFTLPGLILACLAYNIGTMMAGETGYNLWKHSKY
jgi:hypothetical protein